MQQLAGRVAVVTGAASGIGRALAERFAKDRARRVICADINGEGAKATADSVGGRAFTTDVSKEADIQSLIETVEAEEGPIDLFCSNAGIGYGGGVEVDDARWQRIWDINLMAHVWAARHLVPRMAARGGGSPCSRTATHPGWPARSSSGPAPTGTRRSGPMTSSAPARPQSRSPSSLACPMTATIVTISAR